MNRILSVWIAALMLSACATAQLPPNATPDQTAAAKAAAAQAKFNTACKYAAGAVGVAEPVVTVVKAKLSENDGLAIDSFLSLVHTTCATPLDITNTDAIIQRVYDAAGNIIALVIKSQQST